MISEAPERNFFHKTQAFIFARQRLDGAVLLSLQICMFLSLLPHALFQRRQVMIYCLVLLCWQCLIWLGKLNAPTRLTRSILILVTVIVLFAYNHTLSGQNVGIELLIMMTCLKYFEVKGPRDWAIIQGLCLFALLTLFLYNSSIIMWIYSMLVIFAIYLSMSQSTFAKSTSTPTTLQAMLRTMLARNNIKPLLGLMIVSLPFAAISFVLLPRFDAPLWNFTDSERSARTGLAERLSPGNISKLSDSDEPAFRVKFFSSAPEIADMYWRGPVFTAFNGQFWSEPRNINENPLFAIPGHPPDKFQRKILPYHYRVTLLPHDKYWLFALGFDNAPPEHSAYSNIDELKANNRINSFYNYEITALPRVYFLKHASGVAPESERYLNLPNLYAKKTRALVQQIKQTLDPALPYDEQMRDQALRYFTDNNFYYTKTPPLLPYDPIDQFMFETRKGYCEHYAAAFAVMMRAAGIPARIVTGYHGAEFNPRDDYYIVRQRNAHAWTEIWLKRQGWVRVDPTYAVPISRVDQDTLRSTSRGPAGRQIHSNIITQSLYEVSLLLDALDYQWDRQVAGFDNSTQMALFSFLQELPDVNALFYIALLVLIIVLWKRINKADKRKVTDPIINRYYEKCCRILAKKGFRKAEYEPPNHFAARVGRALPALREPLQSITDLYCQQRYGRQSPSFHKMELIKLLRQLHGVSIASPTHHQHKQ